MVKAIVDLAGEANTVLNIVKAQYGLKDKSQAINKMAEQYKEIVLESDIRPEYIKKIRTIQKEPIIRIGSLPDFKKRYCLK